MRVLEFRFTEYQQERSRDSNGQLEHVEFKDGVLSYVSEWQGYHPAGGGGRMPASDYTLDEALHAELVDYLEQNGLTTPQSEAPAADDPTLRHESRSYGQTFELTTDAGSCRIHFGYQTSGPRINAHDQHPLNLKLTALHAFLKGLQLRATHKPKTPEEFEAEQFFNRNGYRPGQIPTIVSELCYYTTVQRLFRYEWQSGTTPFLFQHGGGDEFFVRYRTQETPERRVTYRAAEPFFEELAALVVQQGLHEAPESTYYSNDELPLGELKLNREFKVTFDRNANWRHQYTFTHYDTPEIRAKYSSADSLIVRFDRFEAGLRALLESSPHLELIKES